MKYIFTLVFLLIIQQLFAQRIEVRGVVKTGDGKALANATAVIYYPGTKDSLRAVTNSRGEFRFLNVIPQKVGVLISYVGYKKFQDVFDFSGVQKDMVMQDLVLTPGDNTLEAVTVESSKVQIKEDTVSYVIDSTMYRKNDNVEEVIKKLPGVQVDKDGKITAQGKEVTKVKVNGKEFFGGDVKTATRELNADMVDKIQIIDDYGDQSAFTGIKDGDPSKTLNIQLKKDKNKGYFGNATAGAGTKSRYLGSLSFNRFNGNQQISLTGNINNTNTSTFNFSNLPGGMGAVAGNMVRSFGVGTGGAGVGSFFNNNNDGVGVTKSIGLNYRDEWSPKISAYGSYSISSKNNLILNDINQKLIQEDSSFSNNQKTTDRSVTDNHRFSFNIEYKIDSFNYVKFNPGFSFRKVRDNYRADFTYYDSSGRITNNGFNTDLNNSETPNYTGSLLFNHRFHKKGRTLSLNFSAGKSSTDAVDDLYNASTYYFNNGNSIFSPINQYITQENDNHNYGVSASFNEQLSKTRSLEFNYAYNKRFTGNDKETFDDGGSSKVMIDSLTNIYENIYTTNRFGLNLRTNLKKYNYSVGFAVQPATIESNSFTQTKLHYTQHLVNYYPVVRFAYNFSRSRSFNLNYNGSTNQPTYQQLQPVYDYSNRTNIIVGNPDLKPEFNNTLSIRYNNFDLISGDVFFGNLSGTYTKDKIVSNIISLGNGLQETRYLNADGYYNLNGFYNISKPIQNRKYVFNLGGNVNFIKNISYLKYVKNKGRNLIVGQRFTMDYKLKKWLETSGGVNFSLNDARYSLTSFNNSTIKTWSITNSGRLFFKHNFILSYDLDKTINSGYADNVVANPLIVNATLEKQLFAKQNASVKLQAFDLLDENTSVSRNVTANAITDTRTNRLGRYFMLSFVYRLNKFASQQQRQGAGGMPGGGVRIMGGPGF